MIFRCDMCQYRGTAANLLRMHMRRMHPEHTKDLRICEICNHKTRSADDMQKHVKLFHPEHCYARDKEQSKQQQMKKYAVDAIYVRFSMADLSIAWKYKADQLIARKSKSKHVNVFKFLFLGLQTAYHAACATKPFATSVNFTYILMISTLL